MGRIRSYSGATTGPAANLADPQKPIEKTGQTLRYGFIGRTAAHGRQRRGFRLLAGASAAAGCLAPPRLREQFRGRGAAAGGSSPSAKGAGRRTRWPRKAACSRSAWRRFSRPPPRRRASGDQRSCMPSRGASFTTMIGRNAPASMTSISTGRQARARPRSNWPADIERDSFAGFWGNRLGSAWRRPTRRCPASRSAEGLRRASGSISLEPQHRAAPLSILPAAAALPGRVPMDFPAPVEWMPRGRSGLGHRGAVRGFPVAAAAVVATGRQPRRTAVTAAVSPAGQAGTSCGDAVALV